MPSFSKGSLEKLGTCDPRLQNLFNKVIERFDCAILCGYRGRDEQEKAFKEGRSQLQYPQSKHNRNPSLAVDVAPYPIDWNDARRFYLFAGFVLGTAEQMGIKIRWGGDWKRKFLLDSDFIDEPHFELVEE